MHWCINAEKRNEKRYISNLQGKYAERSHSELVGIYNDLLQLKKCMENSAVAEKREAYAKDSNEQMELLMTQMAATMMLETVWNKYPFEISSEYYHYDIAYLKKLL